MSREADSNEGWLYKKDHWLQEKNVTRYSRPRLNAYRIIEYSAQMITKPKPFPTLYDELHAYKKTTG